MNITTPDKYEWQDDAACAGMNTDEFFNENSGGPIPLRVRRICNDCPVRFLCLEEALKCEGDEPAKYRFGYFGGLSPTARYKEHKARQLEKRFEELFSAS